MPSTECRPEIGDTLFMAFKNEQPYSHARR